MMAGCCGCLQEMPEATRSNQRSKTTTNNKQQTNNKQTNQQQARLIGKP